MSTSDLERLGAGREAEVFAWSDGRVLRLAIDPGGAGMIEREAIAVAAAYEAGASVPRVHERVTVDGRPGLVLDRVDGGDLLTRLGRRPWTFRQVATTLGAEHAAIHRTQAPDGLPTLRDELRRRLGSSLVPDATAGDPAADVARTILLVGGGELPDGTPVLVRALAPAARRLLLAGYLRAYGRELPLDRGLVGRWLPVWAAARLSEGIDAERESLLRRAR